MMANPDQIRTMTTWIARVDQLSIVRHVQFSVVSTRKAQPYILATDGRTSLTLRPPKGNVSSCWGQQVLDHFGIQAQ
jgi:hypothetical protein